jgi:hypothetical protein
MKFYCFLLIIILLCLLYDNNLYEGNDELYDTNEDRITGRIPSETTDDESLDGLQFLSDLGLYDYISDYLPETPTPTCTDNEKSEDCATPTSFSYGNSLTGDDWPYGDDMGAIDSPKAKCIKCFKCKDKGIFIDQFYAHLCDAMKACYIRRSEFTNEDHPKLPYVYAYNNTYSVGTYEEDGEQKDFCSQTNLNAPQISLCKLFNQNTLMDTILIPKKPASALCNAEIFTKENNPLNLL